MKNLKRNRGLHWLFSTIYIVVLGLMLFMVLVNIALKSPKSEPYGLGGFTSLDEEWFTDDGQAFEIAEIDKLRMGEQESIFVYHKIGPKENEGQTLVFRSKNCFVTVYLDGEELYQTAVAEAPFYNHSMGTRWNVVELGPQASGKTIEIEIYQAYRDGRAKIDNFYLGDGTAVIVHLIREKIFGCVLSLMMLFVGILLFCAWIVLNLRRTSKDNSLLWLSMFAMLTATWCLLETNLLQLFNRDLRLIQLVDNMMLVAAGIPLYLYLDSMHEAFRYRLIRILCGLDVAYVTVATVLQMMGSWDYHQTLNGAVFNYGVIVILLIFFVVQQWRTGKMHEDREEAVVNGLQLAGLLMLGVGVLGDLARYLLMDVMDRAFIIRICLLLFIILFGSGNIYHMALLVRKGVQTELISSLAYCDGLTGVKNRTAYQERLDALEKGQENDELLFVMLDINNLKVVNDTLGHQAGDNLIVACSQLMKDTFGTIGEIYRIGGDEFVVLICGEDVWASYEVAARTLEKKNNKVVSDEGDTYIISIAYGAALCESKSIEGLDEAEHRADLAMYKNKMEIKSCFSDHVSEKKYI